jgi:FtsP/CotA-like multicopper oxidase with cupredoxin domain
MQAAIPSMYPRALLTMADMGSMDGMDMSSDTDAAPPGKRKILYYRNPMGGSDTSPVPKKDAMGMDYIPVYEGDATTKPSDAPMEGMTMDSMDMSGMDMSKPMSARDTQPKGWLGGFPPGEKVLSYADLKALTPNADTRPADKELVLHLTGNMQRFIWTINGKKDGEGAPIELRYGERVKITFINDTMMAHPMHLHGMFVELLNGQPAATMPKKHIVIVPPGQSYSVMLTANEEGTWAFHCHLLYHMAAGMMTELTVTRAEASR